MYPSIRNHIPFTGINEDHVEEHTVPNWLARRLDKNDVLVVPGAFDPFSARLAALAGHEAVYVGGYSSLAAGHGLPDLGIAGRTDMVEIHRRIHSATRIPVIVDADTGYGGPASIRRTVLDLAQIGVAAVQIEDQVNPKKCGHLEHKQVVGIDEAVLRVRVAVEAAHETGTAIIARTDALQQFGVGAAIERSNLFLQAGATAVFVDAPHTVEEIAAIPRDVEGPLVFNAAATGRGPALAVTELEDLGYAMVIFPIEAFLAAMSGARRALADLKQFGRVDTDPFITFDEVNEILGVHDVVAWERRLLLDH